MKKVFFFDIDDTLLPKNGELSKENIKAIKELEKKGHDVYIATGKSVGMAKSVIDILSVSNYITSNGAVINENHKEIYSKPILKEDIEDVLKIVKGYDDVVIGGQGNINAYIIGDNKKVYDKYVVPIYKGLSVQIPQQIFEFKEPIYQLWGIGNVDKLEVDPKYDTFRWDKNGIDIIYKGTSKSQAIEYLLGSKYKNQQVQTYAFGDSMNDITMFKLVDKAIAVSNAKEELKEVADEIADNKDNKGIYNYLKKYEII